ncbi:MAG: transcription initiation factor IIB family protein [Promethearchaeota archaeon]
MSANSDSNSETKENKNKMVDQSLTKCPECGCEEIIRDYLQAELICSNCGLVISEHMIAFKTRRAFSAEERKEREHVGSPLSNILPDYGLSTCIDKNNPDGASSKEIQKFNRIRKWNTRMDWHHRNLSIATNEIRRICSHLELPSRVSDRAAILYRKVYKQNLLKGRSIKSMVCACIYIACREHKIPRTLTEICGLSSENQKTIRRCYKIILQNLKIKVPNLKATELIAKMASNLQISKETENRALEIIQIAKKNRNLTGKDPKGIAAAAIYLAALEMNNRKSQSEVSKVAEITEVTLRNRYKELLKIISEAT